MSTKLDPNQIIWYDQRTTSGRQFQCSRRTAAHLDYTKAQLAKQHPGMTLAIIQGCYNTGVEASAGTHDFDAVLDVRIIGLNGKEVDWFVAQAFLRSCGWAAWFRHTGSWAAVSAWHIHMVSIGYTTKVGIYVPGQVYDYYHHTFGLKGQHNVDLDKSWFPGDVGPNPPVGTPAQWAADINKTIFDFALWEQELEDNMGYSDWAPADKAALAQDVAAVVAPAVVKTLMAQIVSGDLTFLQVERRMAGVPGMVKELAQDLGHPIKKDPANT